MIDCSCISFSISNYKKRYVIYGVMSMLIQLDIYGLFGRFDYNIILDKNIKIITGMNGYGKTTILKIIQAIYDQDIFFFTDLLFSQIVYKDETQRFWIEKKDKRLVVENEEGEICVVGLSEIKNLIEKFSDGEPYYRRSDGFFVDTRDGEIISIVDQLERKHPKLISNWTKNFPRLSNHVYTIREQRLFNFAINNRMSYESRMFFRPERYASPFFSETIEKYSEELKNELRNVIATNAKVIQELDSSFPQRLFNETEKIDKDEFEIRIRKIQDFQNILSKYSIQKNPIEKTTTYKLENATALRVYINDTEKKLDGYRSIVEKLELFTSILNQRRFAFKKISINMDEGIVFTFDEQHQIALANLSSGEKQEVIMLYELLFKVQNGSVILIDEPEISLHVAWQKAFLDDLEKILKNKESFALVATHAPYIISDRWEQTIDLSPVSK